MVLSSKPKSEVDALIGRGGTVADEPPPVEPSVQFVQLRLMSDLVAEIDDLIDQRRVRISRHTWLLEAITEKIDRGG